MSFRLIFFLILYISLLGCKAQFHIDRAEKHTKKAIDKGAVISKSDTITHTDTITKIETINDTTYITNNVTHTITKEGELRYITRVDKRREYRLEKQNNRLKAKNERLSKKLKAKNERVKVRHETKIERIKNRSLWWIWALVGYLLNFVVRFLVSRYLPFFKK